jgi:hypothetical protein
MRAAGEGTRRGGGSVVRVWVYQGAVLSPVYARLQSHDAPAFPLPPARQSDATPLALVPSGPQAAELRELLQSWAEGRAGAEPGTEH